MLRLVALVILVAGIVAVLGPRRLRLVGLAVLGLALVYAVLKLAGVIDAGFPSRTGVL